MFTTGFRETCSRTAQATALLAFALAAGFGPAATPAEAAETDPVFTTRGNLAIRGYDPVAYFTDEKAVKGSRDFSHDWQGATWRFASAENRDLFAAEPTKYAPQYGGYCAWAVSRNYTAPTDPDAFTLVNGKLYLNYNAKVMKQWLEERDQNIDSADKNWPSVLEE